MIMKDWPTFRDQTIDAWVENRIILTKSEREEYDKTMPRITDKYEGIVLAAKLLRQDRPVYLLIGTFAIIAMVVNLIAQGLVYIFRLIF